MIVVQLQYYRSSSSGGVDVLSGESRACGVQCSSGVVVGLLLWIAPCLGVRVSGTMEVAKGGRGHVVTGSGAWTGGRRGIMGYSVER